ncbi:hypothetical protein [Salmonella phage SD-1_S14]|nr:hypothetical protein [Salmonella phage SD-2_S15]WPK19263.1 hypothetical protein [Salmonella phage SD-6_S16]WPK19938.1 hypothetical protein [Salmonella phage SD-1_S14]WPK20956.1 hypothetical protein [Salmonella phage SD-15_S21]
MSIKEPPAILTWFFIQPHCREGFKLCPHLTGFFCCSHCRTAQLPSTFSSGSGT